MSRVLSVDNFVSTPFAAAQGNVIKGATATVTVVEEAPVIEDALYAVFVTEEQFKDEEFTSQCSTIDFSMVRAIAKADGFTGASGAVVAVNKAGAPVIVVGISNKPTLATVRAAANEITNKAIATKRSNVVVFVPTQTTVTELVPTTIGYGKGVKGTEKSDNKSGVLSINQLVDVVVRGLFYPNWKHDLYLKDQATIVSNFTLVGAGLPIDEVYKAVAGAESVTFTREIGSLRFQDANNTYMKDTLVKLAATHSDVFKITVYDRTELLAQGYNLICAVNQASWDPCYIVTIEYTPPGYVEEGVAPYAFVAKTLTFDTGGLDLKPPAGMLSMHVDKLGGCNQLGGFRYLGLTRPATKNKIIGAWTITDNAIGSKAVHPHSIISTTSVHGHNMSVAIDNTDAEGRLALADAVTLVQNKFKPSRVTTTATLTGAVMISLGNYMTGLFTNAPYLVDPICQIGQRNGEPFWNLPIIAQNYKDLAGKDCDLKNITGVPYMGSSTAAAFIDAFVGEGVEFIHWDIAGSSSTGQNEVTGTPCATFQKLFESFQ